MGLSYCCIGNHELYLVCVFLISVLFVSISQVIGRIHVDRLQK